MELGEILVTLITGLPNLAVALYVIWKQDQRLDRSYELLERLVERSRSNPVQALATRQEETH